MRAIVYEKFHTYKQNTENNIFHLYADVKRNVAVGVGVTSLNEDHMLLGFKATKAYWSVKDSPNAKATEEMVLADYRACQTLFDKGVTRVSRFAEVTTLRLSPAGSKELTKWVEDWPFCTEHPGLLSEME